MADAKVTLMLLLIIATTSVASLPTEQVLRIYQWNIPAWSTFVKNEDIGEQKVEPVYHISSDALEEFGTSTTSKEDDVGISDNKREWTHRNGRHNRRQPYFLNHAGKRSEEKGAWYNNLMLRDAARGDILPFYLYRYERKQGRK